MLSKFKLQSLKQKLWAIVVASFVARVIVFFVIEDTTTSIATDEGTYASLVKWTAESKPASKFPDFGEHLYLSARSIVLPASILSRLGITELSALRLISSFYGFLSLCVVAYLCSKLIYFNFSEVEKSKKIERLVLALLMTYAFFPSHFVWSNLGLRESSNEFWLIMTLTGVFLLFREGQSHKLQLAALISISIICTFSSRPQVGWVLVISLLIYSTLMLKNKLSYLLIVSVLTGLFVGYSTTTSYAYVKKDVDISTDISTDGSRLTITERELSWNLLEAAVGQIGQVPEKQTVNQVGAASKIERLPCPWEETSEIGKYGCLAFRAPYMTITFLFRPLPFVDTTSLSSTFAAAENTLWIAIFALILYRLSKIKRIPFFGELIPSIIFVSLYVVGAGSYQGNMGTAFRHKSLILWVVLLLFFAAFWPNQKQPKKPQGNNSQESAV
jgi:hypothetical protein